MALNKDCKSIIEKRIKELWEWFFPPKCEKCGKVQ